MRIIGVTGTENSEKTAFVTSIIAELRKRGFQVCSVKYAHKGLDVKNKDKMQDPNTGVELVVGTGNETFFSLQKNMNLEEILNILEYMTNLDFIVLEGFKDSEYAKIATSDYAISAEDSSTILKTVDVKTLKDHEIKSLVDLIERRSFGIIRGLDCKKCGFGSCKEFRTAKISGAAGAEVQCVIDSNNVLLKVNGSFIPMNPFVESLIKNVTLGIVESLQTKEFNTEDFEKIELLIRK